MKNIKYVLSMLFIILISAASLTAQDFPIGTYTSSYGLESDTARYPDISNAGINIIIA